MSEALGVKWANFRGAAGCHHCSAGWLWWWVVWLSALLAGCLTVQLTNWLAFWLADRWYGCLYGACLHLKLVYIWDKEWSTAITIANLMLRLWTNTDTDICFKQQSWHGILRSVVFYVTKKRSWTLHLGNQLTTAWPLLCQLTMELSHLLDPHSSHKFYNLYVSEI